MEKFITKWNGVSIEDWGGETSFEFHAFAKQFEKYLVSILPENAKLCSYTVGHYSMSAFVCINDKYIYLTYSVPRGGTPLDLTTGNNPWKSVLIRTAKSSSDYTGGVNTYYSVENLKNGIIYNYERM